MSALPKQSPELDRDEPNPTNKPSLKLHNCRLDYDAALREHLAGGCASRVARAAGSKATSQRNLRRVGLKIVAKLKSRGDVLEAFDQLGFTIHEFCRGVVEQTQATKTTRVKYRGRLLGEYSAPDWRARTAARWMYLKATGLLELPLESADWHSPAPFTDWRG